MNAPTPHPTIVVGASRGLRRAIAVALAEDAGPVVAVARDQARLADLAAATPGVVPERADAADPEAATRLLRTYDPRTVVLVAGATPTMAPLQHQTWVTFSANWHADVQIAFHWIRAALARPLPPGSRVIVISSGAALAGSPLSGGYAGAKATQRFLAGYAQEEASRAELDLASTTVFPRPSPMTDVGRAAVQAYSARDGLSEEAYVHRLGGVLTPAIAGRALVELRAADTTDLSPGYLLTGDGLKPMG
ncbi:SDR family NAD(P)-dependent oxidoreductase [Modestobacter excelsi]|uniref:SDR family NAD(P)-dependent oxidoreductase n=1 Tax=Modestobacter excelsi TaxID=2213161 RepID=UPI00110CAF10|nr:SDR family oxidoreductase [Modestobacter excelsi]